MAVTVGDIRTALDAAYPPHLAHSWDRVGLICGDPNEEVTHVSVALDCTDAVADAAIAAGSQMLVVHHPLLLRGVSTVAADTPKGRIVHKLIRAGVALFAAHTNADAARPGVNDVLAELLGVTPGAPLGPQNVDKLDLWAVKVPLADAEAVREAMFTAGAGELGDYSECSFSYPGEGRFRPSTDANPHLGERGELEHVDELKIELVAPKSRRAAVRDALIAAHPYEEPAYDIIESAVDAVPAEEQLGIGRIGELDEPMPFRDFVARVGERLPKTEWGVRGAGDPERIIRRVAVSSGSGDSFLDAATAAGVDAFVSSDLRHHPVDEALRAGAPCIVDTAHWASEFPWCGACADLITRETGVTADVLTIRTDPWTVAAGATYRQEQS
ncbi:Nif3-like dinuclear metal center hexameric protein [Corynebacterium sp. TAE3-ERU12]|uniref:Nif3-like dinuclear metal center hexameric protein n=1 Tax=Corynebacterium sp. TAE3-ERU12 TaxID=2849491 RepID=UPI001C46C7C7|nr:Nif3-like dinuclear metal center hexameric protein [Corynebacterium sp. TAE3-ERU12]MBV7295807.1 Nif3-like dinuclear metal center hexameric protein [Corynebacterium sp. TAE3-ERU12]